jgi:hypothetical protein
VAYGSRRRDGAAFQARCPVALCHRVSCERAPGLKPNTRARQYPSPPRGRAPSGDDLTGGNTIIGSRASDRPLLVAAPPQPTLQDRPPQVDLPAATACSATAYVERTARDARRGWWQANCESRARPRFQSGSMTRSDPSPYSHIFSVDVEEYFQVNTLDGVVSRANWPPSTQRSC